MTYYQLTKLVSFLLLTILILFSSCDSGYNIQDVSNWCCNNLIEDISPTGENCTWILNSFNPNKDGCIYTEEPRNYGIMPFYHSTLYKNHFNIRLHKSCKEINSAYEDYIFYKCDMKVKSEKLKGVKNAN